MTAITEFLFPAPAPRAPAAVISWWEGRRLVYNACVGAAGVCSLTVMSILFSMPPSPHALGFPPLAIIAFGVAANVCYCLGPAAELMLGFMFGRRLLPTGPTLFRMGLTFSVGLALLPSLMAWFDFAIRVVKFVL